MTERYPRYTLRPGDVLDISFEFSPEFNQTASIQPDGFVSLKSVGDLHVAGQALPEVTKTITAAYSQLLNTPVISIVLKEYEKPYFVASGNVMRPGKYELRGDTTLTEAIAIAGGLNDAAKKSQILLFRRINDGWMEATELNVKQMFAKHNLKEDPHLKSGDMIFVPNSRISNFKRYIPAPGVGMSISPRPF